MQSLHRRRQTPLGVQLQRQAWRENEYSAETGLSQGFLRCVKDYGSSITVGSKARGGNILREFEEAHTTFTRFE